MNGLKSIKGNMTINAHKEKVWDVLIDDKFTKIWYAEFGEGTHAITDWKVGSKVQFRDKSGSGLVGKIISNQPGELLSIEYYGLLDKGVEDLDSEGAKQVKGGREIYKLTEEDGVTTLQTEADMAEDFFEMMSDAWERALQKIKELSEAA